MVTHANGSIFTGSYDNDVACGEASFLYPGGHTEVKGTWLQGQLHGEVRFDASLPMWPLCRWRHLPRRNAARVIPSTQRPCSACDSLHVTCSRSSSSRTGSRKSSCGRWVRKSLMATFKLTFKASQTVKGAKNHRFRGPSGRRSQTTTAESSIEKFGSVCSSTMQATPMARAGALQRSTAACFLCASQDLLSWCV